MAMDRYLLPRPSTPEEPTPPLLKYSPREQWRRSLAQVKGRIFSNHQHQDSALLLQSYSQIGVFCHSVSDDGGRCPTLSSQHPNFNNRDLQLSFLKREGISGLEFDNKGIYLASCTFSGCLTVHDFETLCCLCSDQSLNAPRKEVKPVLHLPVYRQLDVVRWNTSNQDEIACASMRTNEVHLFDIGYISTEPIEVLKTIPTSMHGYVGSSGLSDIAFMPEEHSRVFASSLSGLVYAWDRRISNQPCVELASSSGNPLNSIELNLDNWIIFGASNAGFIYAWDLRGGKTSLAFQSHKEVYNPPLTSMKLSCLLEKITSLKAQSNIVSQEIHSIDLDPSCPYQLAFHLDNGWSGVLNTHSLEVTHVHCPPPILQDDEAMPIFSSCLRKPSWLPTSSIYAVGPASGDGIYLLDFFPDKTSACHVDQEVDAEEISLNVNNVFIPLSDSVTGCTAHPLNGTLVAGTKGSSLLIVSQRHQSVIDVGVCNPSS